MRSELAWNSIHHLDCVQGLERLAPGSVDLAFADPPFNIGFSYDVYNDTQSASDYLDWSKEWMQRVYQVLKPDGTFWLAIGDEYAAELKLLAQSIGFQTRSWVIWYYTFGVNCSKKFSRSHAHLFYFVKDAKQFTFRDEELENRIPSARQLVYNDRRANPTGRLPDDTWILRPQDLAEQFSPAEDTWYFPRVAGTFKERAGFHGCQMPEQLLGRIIRLCSNPGELVLDPFSGSATTLAVAKKLHRQYVGFDLSAEYIKLGTERLGRIQPGDKLDGAAEPTMSAPSTVNGKILGSRPRSKTKKRPGRKPRNAHAIRAVTSVARKQAKDTNFEQLLETTLAKSELIVGTKKTKTSSKKVKSSVADKAVRAVRKPKLVAPVEAPPQVQSNAKTKRKTDAKPDTHVDSNHFKKQKTASQGRSSKASASKSVAPIPAASKSKTLKSTTLKSQAVKATSVKKTKPVKTAVPAKLKQPTKKASPIPQARKQSLPQQLVREKPSVAKTQASKTTQKAASTKKSRTLQKSLVKAEKKTSKRRS